MSYIATDASTQDGEPVLLVQFTQGGTSWRYASIASDVSHLAVTWSASPIKTGTFMQTNEMAKDTLSITLPRNNPFALYMLSDSSDQITSVTIYRGHVTDAEYVVYWKGRVSSFKAKGESVSIECEPIFTSLKRAGLRARYQKSCRHVLYGSGCGLTSTDFDYAATVSATVGSAITLLSDPSGIDGSFTGGMIEYNAQLRYIVSHVGTTLTLMRPFVSLGDEVTANGNTGVTLYFGCDHTKATCLSKFNNLLNYGGFPWIPSKNPMGGSGIT